MTTLPSDESDSTPELDALLREAPPSPVPDDGFSARVLRALPPAQPHSRRVVPRGAEGRRWFLCTLGLAAGLLLGLAHKDETSWARVDGSLERLSGAGLAEALGRWDSPLWMTALTLGGTYLILKYLERPTGMERE